MTGHNTGFRCPECGAASPWEVEECDACGYRSETLRAWHREARRRDRRETRDGCLSVLFDSMFWIDGIVELALLIGRGVMLLLRAVWGLFT